VSRRAVLAPALARAGLLRAVSLAVMVVTASLAFPVCREAGAHEARTALLALKELSPGTFSLAWYPPVRGPGGVEVIPRFPSGCRWEGIRLVCPEDGGPLAGAIRFEGLESSRAEVLVQVSWLGGASRTEVLSAARPALEVGAPGSQRAAWGQIALGYLKMGWQHILAGFDHLLFVVALVLLVGHSGRLLWTITAFTAAHSLTLAASVLGLVTLPAAAVEIVIALSIALVAVECCKGGDSLTRRYPWLVSFGFGLLHGFGFAGALAEIGLPPGRAWLALLGFNLGVELGQLAAVATLYGVHRLLGRWPLLAARQALARTVVVYGIGTLAVYWAIDRAAARWS
jgi:hypothetical protein